MTKQIIQAGVGKAAIALPDDLFPIQGFHDAHDPLHARALLWGADLQQLLISLELTSLKAYEIEHLKEVAAQQTGIAQHAIWISVTHTFNAPHTRSLTALAHAEEQIRQKNKLLWDCIEQEVMQAVALAMLSKEEATVSYASTACRVNVNRDVETASGWWLGRNEKGYSDHEIPVVMISNRQNQLIAVLFSYDVQSSVMDGCMIEHHQRVTSDLSGRACSFLEEQLPGSIAMFLIGAAGDQAPIFQAVQTELKETGERITIDHQETGFQLVECLGTRLGSAVLQAVSTKGTGLQSNSLYLRTATISLPGQCMPDRTALYPTRSYHYQVDHDQETQIEILHIGDVAIVGLQPEIASHMASKIKQQSPFALTMVATMINGGAKYMAEKESYDRMTYEAMNSAFAKGSGELLCDAVLKLLIEEYQGREKDI